MRSSGVTSSAFKTTTAGGAGEAAGGTGERRAGDGVQDGREGDPEPPGVGRGGSVGGRAKIESRGNALSGRGDPDGIADAGIREDGEGDGEDGGAECESEAGGGDGENEDGGGDGEAGGGDGEAGGGNGEAAG